MFLTHPLLLFTVANIAVTTTAAYTARNSSLRYALLVVLTACLPIYLQTLQTYASTTGFAGRTTAGVIFWNIVTCFDKLLVRGWDYCHYKPSATKTTEVGKEIERDSTSIENTTYQGTHMDFGAEVTGNTRGVDLFWEVKNVPPFSTADPTFIPSRAAFLLVQIVACVACYQLNNRTVQLMAGVDSQYLGSTHVPLFARLPEVSLAELRVRLVVSVGYWVVQYCNIQFFYSAFGLLSVLTNSKNVRLWRPLFGSRTEACTIRDFWGRSWHQMLRSGLERCSNFVAHDVLHLDRRGLPQRYTKIFCSFALSGVMHIFADMGGGLTMRQSGALQFFCMQAMGIVVEDAVRCLWREHGISVPGSYAATLEKVVGYTWVVLFLVWTSPVWVYPVTLNMRKEDALLGIDAFKPILFGK